MISALAKFFKSKTINTEPTLVSRAPKITLDMVHCWAERAVNSGMRYIIVVHTHNLCDPSDLDETTFRGCFTKKEVEARCDRLNRSLDSTVLQVIDLTQDLDEQLAKASYIDRS